MLTKMTMDAVSVAGGAATVSYDQQFPLRTSQKHESSPEAAFSLKPI